MIANRSRKLSEENLSRLGMSIVNLRQQQYENELHQEVNIDWERSWDAAWMAHTFLREDFATGRQTLEK